MKKAVAAVLGIGLIALWVSAADAGDKGRARRHVVAADSRGGVEYYPGWGRDPVLIYGVPAGLVYGGAMSAPAKR